MQINFKNYKTLPLISVILGISFLADFLIRILISCFESYQIDIGVLRIPSNPFLILTFLTLYNKYLWKWKLTSFLVDVPNIHGRYEGTLNFSNKYAEGSLDAVLEVNQTASNISINSYFFDGEKYSGSSSKVVELNQVNGFYNLYFLYHNSGTTGSVEFAPHEGVNIFKVRENEEGKKVLDGYYFNNRSNNPGNGTIVVTHKSNNLKGGFNG